MACTRKTTALEVNWDPPTSLYYDTGIQRTTVTEKSEPLKSPDAVEPGKGQSE